MPSSQRGKYCNLTCAASAHKGPVSVKNKGERYKRAKDEDGYRDLEHRLMMEKKLGRKLVRGENVHHKNGDKKDNSDDNLELWYKPQPAGQRVTDLIEYIVKHHRSTLQSHLSCLLDEPESLNREAA